MLDSGWLHFWLCDTDLISPPSLLLKYWGKLEVHNHFWTKVSATAHRTILAHKTIVSIRWNHCKTISLTNLWQKAQGQSFAKRILPFSKFVKNVLEIKGSKKLSNKLKLKQLSGLITRLINFLAALPMSFLLFPHFRTKVGATAHHTILAKITIVSFCWNHCNQYLE